MKSSMIMSTTCLLMKINKSKKLKRRVMQKIHAMICSNIRQKITQTVGRLRKRMKRTRKMRRTLGRCGPNSIVLSITSLVSSSSLLIRKVLGASPKR